MTGWYYTDAYQIIKAEVDISPYFVNHEHEETARRVTRQSLQASLLQEGVDRANELGWARHHLIIDSHLKEIPRGEPTRTTILRQQALLVEAPEYTEVHWLSGSELIGGRLPIRSYPDPPPVSLTMTDVPVAQDMYVERFMLPLRPVGHPFHGTAHGVAHQGVLYVLEAPQLTRREEQQSDMSFWTNYFETESWEEAVSVAQYVQQVTGNRLTICKRYLQDGDVSYHLVLNHMAERMRETTAIELLNVPEGKP